MKGISFLTPQERKAVRLFSETLAKIFGERVMLLKLFGSSVRGERGEESDIDILVLIDGLTDVEKRRVWDEGTLINIDCDALLSPLVMRPEELQKLRDRERRIALDIDREGIEL